MKGLINYKYIVINGKLLLTINICSVYNLKFCSQDEKKAATTLVFRVVAAFFGWNKYVA
jgi:hypothetical protein